jgi:hypothetical protein
VLHTGLIRTVPDILDRHARIAGVDPSAARDAGYRVFAGADFAFAPAHGVDLCPGLSGVMVSWLCWGRC